MLHCPAHAAPRRDMTVSVDAAMVAAAGPGHNPLLAAASLAALGNDALRLQVLLGSPPPGSISAVSSGYTTVLKASADFIRTIYNTHQVASISEAIGDFFFFLLPRSWAVFAKHMHTCFSFLFSSPPHLGGSCKTNCVFFFLFPGVIFFLSF